MLSRLIRTQCDPLTSRRSLGAGFLVMQRGSYYNGRNQLTKMGMSAERRLSSRAALIHVEEEYEENEDYRPQHGMGKHYESPDSSGTQYQLSYTLPPVQLASLPSKLSNFANAKQWFERLVLDGNQETKEVYVDLNALQMFDVIFPEIGQSRRIGRIESQHFETWDFHSDPQRVHMEKAFQLLLQQTSPQRGEGMTDQTDQIERQDFERVLRKNAVETK